MKRVLIVEDEELERRALSGTLRAEGFAVVAAATAGEALVALDAGRFDAALVDVMMPGVHGIALARMIASRHRDLRIVLMSAYHLSCRQLARLDVGGVRFVGKPLERAALLDALHAVSAAAPAPAVRTAVAPA